MAFEHAVACDDSLPVEHQYFTRSCCVKDFCSCGTRSACPGNNDAAIFEFFFYDIKCVYYASQNNNRRPMLVVMHYRDIQTFNKLLLNLKTFRRCDIFKVYSAKSGRDTNYCFYYLICVLSIEY